MKELVIVKKYYNFNINTQRLKSKMEEAVKKLPERQKEILKYRKIMNKSLRETAKIFGISAERVRQLEYNACKKLKVTLLNLKKKNYANI